MARIFADIVATPARWRVLPGRLRAAYALLGKRALGLWRRPLVKDVPGLGQMALEPWDFIDSRLFFFGVWEPGISHYLRGVIERGAVVADIGANIGYYTLLMSRAVGPEGRVFAIEPGPQIRVRLEDLVERNRLDNVTVVPYGISDRAERRRFVHSPENAGASRFGEPSDDGLELRRLADVIPPELLARLSVIKIDVEGMEPAVMRDLVELLPSLPRRLVICAELRVDAEMQAILARFAKAGFEFLVLPNVYPMLAYPNHPLEAKKVAMPGEGQLDVALVRH